MNSDLIERLGKLQDSCSKQELHLLDTDYVWELVGRTADALKAKDKEIGLLLADQAAYEEELEAKDEEIERLRATIAMWHELWGAWMVSRCKSSGRE